MSLITDRTETDVILGNEKGFYSYSDLNRVEGTVQSIIEYGFAKNLKTKTNWGLPGDFSIDEWPVESQMKRYLNNVGKIREIFAVSITIPNSMEQLDWIGANNIEKVLQTALSRISGVKQSYHYSGDIYAGEDIL